jgi:outer membrane protein OmpA-like peptidoglycan-associated protein
MNRPHPRVPRAAPALAVALLAGLAAGAAHAQQPVSPPPAADAAKPAPLVIFFDIGSATIRPQDEAVLDHASRLYTEARPLVMIVTGATDAVGPAELNLDLSEQRARAVVRALVARGIPAARFQVLAKGETDPSVPPAASGQQPLDRRVEIAWR